MTVATELREKVIEPVPFWRAREDLRSAWKRRGSSAGVTLFETVEEADVPAMLVAVTVNVYATPLVNPVTIPEVEVVVVEIPPDEAAMR